VIDDCRTAFFSGSGFFDYRARVWCIRHSIFFGNGLDRAEGTGGPCSGMVLERLTDSLIANNGMCRGASRELIHDKGGHRNTVIANNPGSLCATAADGMPTN
jgi:hypothetical protein